MPQTLDFCNSFVSWVTKNEQSYGRFQLEATLQIKTPGVATKEYYLLSGVMAGNLYKSHQLVKAPPYYFQAVMSKTDYKVFRVYALQSKNEDSFQTINDTFEQVNFDLHYTTADQLAQVNEVIDASFANAKLNAKVQITTQDHTYLLLTFPIKHINVNQSKTIFQVETGTVMLPNAQYVQKPSIAHIDLAYINFNNQSKAEFAVLEATEVSPENHVRTFSGFQSHPAVINLHKLL
ncbi:MAG TPA: hypothetical protein DCS93_44275 [Microscillaceae bacterium]|nr:hypothetical protein [Microscillaceae bacterium]